MSLIQCKECNKEISNECKTCPNCGAKTERAKLKSKRIRIYVSAIGDGAF